MKNEKKGSRLGSKRVMMGGALGVLTLATTGVASAHLGVNSETREAIKSAFEQKDYAAFQAAAADTKIVDKIDSQEKFDQMLEIKALKESGDREGAQAKALEYGLQKEGRGKHKKDPAVKEAIEANDYTAFQEAINDGRFSEKIDSAEKFAQLVEVNELRLAGKYEEARAIMEGLGIGKGRGDHDHGSRRDSVTE